MTRPTATRDYMLILKALYGLFLFRVLAQYLQSHYSLPFLPKFDAWHSGTIPYSSLLCLQAFALAIGWRWINLAKARTPQSTKRKSQLLFCVGLLYLTLNTSRLLAGCFLYPEHAWFSAHLATVFHFPIALFILCFAHIQWSSTSRLGAEL